MRCDASTKSKQSSRAFRRSSALMLLRRDFTRLSGVTIIAVALERQFKFLLQGTAAQRRPVRARIITISRINPSPPLGQYPHPELYGHAGSAPIKSKIRRINRMVPMASPFSTTFVTARVTTLSNANDVGYLVSFELVAPCAGEIRHFSGELI